jgi:hypothetical protein
MSRPPETKKQREDRMKHNEEVLKKYNLKPPAVRPLLQPEGKVLSMEEAIKRRICTGCHVGNMQELNFGKDINTWKCSICGKTISKE